MTTATLVAPAEGTRWVSPYALNVGDVVLIETVRMGGMGLPLLSSDDGYVHVVADVQDLGRGWMRVRYETFEADGERRASALSGDTTFLGDPGRSFYGWDRLYDMAVKPEPRVEVVS